MTRLSRALRFALDNPYSDFYRRKYGPGYDSLPSGTFSDIPLLTREEVGLVPLYERLFVPKKMVRFVRPTSGSSGRGIMGFAMLEEPELMAYRASIGFHLEDDLAGRYFGPYFTKELSYSLLLFSAVGLVHEAHLCEHDGHTVVVGDYREPEKTVALSDISQVDSLFTFPASLITIAPHFKSRGLAEQIKFILLVGDRMNEFQRKEIAGAFPSAKVATMYSLTESQGLIGHTCENLLSQSPNYIHPFSTFTVELIDPDTGVTLEISEGVEGEVVLTSLVPLAFPLIRYRTGDYAVVRQSGPCLCGNINPIIDILGRCTSDRVKVPHGGISVAALEDALTSLPYALLDFEALWRGDAALCNLEVTIYAHNENELPSSLASELERGLRISSAKTYSDLVTMGEVGPIVLSVKHERDLLSARSKRKRLQTKLP